MPVEGANRPHAATPELFRWLAITPLEQPDLKLARVLWRLNIPAAVDLGREPAEWPHLLSALAAETSPLVGLRIPDGVSLRNVELPASVRFLIAGAPGVVPAKRNFPVPVFVQVCSVQEAEQALVEGASGLIAKGQECGGRVGEQSSYVLLQQVMALAEKKNVRVWCQGGIGLHTAAGAFAAGAFGVVVDSLLAPYPQSSLPQAVKDRVLAMDGSEVVGSSRVDLQACKLEYSIVSPK